MHSTLRALAVSTPEECLSFLHLKGLQRDYLSSTRVLHVVFTGIALVGATEFLSFVHGTLTDLDPVGDVRVPLVFSAILVALFSIPFAWFGNLFRKAALQDPLIDVARAPGSYRAVRAAILDAHLEYGDRGSVNRVWAKLGFVDARGRPAFARVAFSRSAWRRFALETSRHSPQEAIGDSRREERVKGALQSQLDQAWGVLGNAAALEVWTGPIPVYYAVHAAESGRGSLVGIPREFLASLKRGDGCLALFPGVRIGLSVAVILLVVWWVGTQFLPG